MIKLINDCIDDMNLLQKVKELLLVKHIIKLGKKVGANLNEIIIQLAILSKSNISYFSNRDENI